MFQLSKSGPERGDCTAPYSVTLDKEYTVRTFINEVLKNKKEWGYIGIEDDNSIFGDPHCEYAQGRLVSKMKKDVLDKPVISVKADGGWSRMDYLLKIKEKSSS